MDKVEILGVKISRVNFKEALKTVEKFLADGKKHYIVTPNPEQIILAQKNHHFRQILNQADLAIPDGVGLVWASRILQNSKLIERVSGVDLMERLCQRAVQNGWRIGLLGGKGKVAARAAEVLKKRYGGLKIIFAAAGNPSSTFDQKIRKDLPNLDLLLVAYGAPKQEEWIGRNLAEINVGVLMAVGGAFEFLAGRQRRAPKIIQSFGFEWFWRLIFQPWRLKRQLALPEFALRVWATKLKGFKV